MRSSAPFSPPARRSALAALAAAIACGAAPAGAAAALTVTKAGPAPVVLAAGGQVEVKASASGGSGKLSVVLSSSATSASGGTVLAGKGAKVAGKGAKGVSVKGSLPSSLPVGQSRFVLVCASAAKAVTGSKASCKSAGSSPTSAPGLGERLAAATAAGKLTAAKASLYALYAANADPRLPAELRGAGGASSQSTEDFIRDAAANFDSYPKSVQKELVWYFAPPAAPGTPWKTKTAKKKPKKPLTLEGAPKAAAARVPDCAGYSALEDSPYADGYKAPWVGVPTADNNAIVWYQDGEKDAQASARFYARIMPEIWKKLSDEFGAPRSDKDAGCFHGPDGRYDIYVNGTVTFLASGGFSGGRALAATMPYPGNKATWCTDRPSWITIRPGQPRWALAHEFMHAIQFNHKYAACKPQIAWWDEGGATWAADFVYSGDDLEKERWPGWVANPLGQSAIADADYDAWPFWMFLHRTKGTGVLRSIFDQLKSKGAVAAVDAAIPGGLAEQWPKFAWHAYNQSPIGAEGFPITESYAVWDHWPVTPSVPSSPDLVLDGAKEKTFDLPIQNTAATAPLSIAAYHRVVVSDPDVREIKLTNKLKGSAPGHVQAALRMKDGQWKLKDWTGQDPVLCRDNPDEDVQQLIIVSTNAGPTGSIPSFTHQLRARNACERPTFRIVGFSQSIVSDTDRGHGERTDVWNGTPGDPVTVDPCEFGYCDPEAPTTEFETKVTTTANGWVTGPGPQCTPKYTYPTYTLQNPGRISITFDPRGDTGDATVTTVPQIASVGDVTNGTCGAWSTGRSDAKLTATVPRDQVLSGKPFTFSFTKSETIPTEPFSNSASISYTWSKSVTLVRVNEDGSEY